MTDDMVLYKTDWIGVICQALLIFGNLFFTTSNNIYILVSIIAINIIYIVFNRKGPFNIIEVSPYVLWLLIFNLVLFFYGVMTTYGGYSILYHVLVVLSSLLLYINLRIHIDHIEDYIDKFATLALMLIIAYLFIYERSMLVSKWSLLLNGTSWYRLGNGVGVNSNLLALYLCICTFFVIKSFFKQTSKLKKLLLAILIVLASFFIFLSGSKKGTVLLVLFVVLIPIAVNNKKLNIKYLMIGIGSAFIVIYAMINVPVFYNVVGHRFADMFATLGIKTSLKTTNLVGTSTELRVNMFTKAMEMFWQYPLFGGGLNVFFAKSGFGLYSHNNYVELLVSMGFFGFSIYYSFYMYLADKFISLKSSRIKKENIILLLAIVFIDSAAINYYGSILDFFVLAVIYVTLRYDKHGGSRDYVRL